MWQEMIVGVLILVLVGVPAVMFWILLFMAHRRGQAKRQQDAILREAADRVVERNKAS